MSRPTFLYIDTSALLHNILRVKAYAPSKKIIAMVKSNAYGCGIATVLPVLMPHVDAFGVACLEEAMQVRNISSDCQCIIFQGIFSQEELLLVERYKLQCVVHQSLQLRWILDFPLKTKIKVWIKVDTGMHRLGFSVEEVPAVIAALRDCPWVDDDIGMITHLASADEPCDERNQLQINQFLDLAQSYPMMTQSIANSAAIIALPTAHRDVVRPGIMLYGISPIKNKTGQALDLIPVMHFVSAVTTIHHYPPYAAVGYGGDWHSDKASVIGVVPVGYGDGYPRHIASNTSVWINGFLAPIVGRVSMDMMTIDLTECKNVNIGDVVELWGRHIAVETIAHSAATIPYELTCQISTRVIRKQY